MKADGEMQNQTSTKDENFKRRAQKLFTSNDHQNVRVNTSLSLFFNCTIPLPTGGYEKARSLFHVGVKTLFAFTMLPI